jgi:1,4-alpha-glucan branching enzyme/maltooligosyltrehalose trehalohydrolase
MPFGVERHQDGACCFRLWAPAAHHIDLCLEEDGSKESILPMQPEKDGWFA